MNKLIKDEVFPQQIVVNDIFFCKFQQNLDTPDLNVCEYLYKKVRFLKIVQLYCASKDM